MSPVAARISVKGQLTVPKAVRRVLGIETGDGVLFEERDGEVVIRKLPTVDARWVGAVRTTLGEWEDDLDDDL